MEDCWKYELLTTGARRLLYHDIYSETYQTSQYSYGLDEVDVNSEPDMAWYEKL